MTDTVQALREQLRQLRALHASGALDDAQYAESRAPLERSLVDRLLDAPWPIDAAPAGRAPSDELSPTPASRAGTPLWAGLGAFALLLAAAGYWWTGSPGQIGQPPPGFGANGAGGPSAAASDPPAMDKAQFTEMTARLAARLKEQPDDARGWAMLGRSYLVLEQPDEALAAFDRALQLRPDDAAALADYADVLAIKNGQRLEGEPMRLIERALKLDPDNPKALALAGTAAFEEGDYAKAARLWDRVAQTGPADSPIAQQARGAAAEARERARLPAAAAAGAIAGVVAGTVTLAPTLKGRASPDDTVFIFARPAEGSRMPLAIVRKQVKDLPFSFRLDDSQAMSPATRLSAASGRIVVGARISKSGEAMPQAGDLQGFSAATAVGSSGITVVIADELK